MDTTPTVPEPLEGVDPEALALAIEHLLDYLEAQWRGRQEP